MWLSAIKLAVSAGSKIYANKQKTKMAMSEAQLMHATKMAEGQEAYQGKLIRSKTIGLEGRGRFDNFKFARVGARVGSHIG
jgi:5-deoxy-D-glucuronate isomerase